MQKIIIHDFNSLLDNQLENAQAVKSILPNFPLVGPGYLQNLVDFKLYQT